MVDANLSEKKWGNMSDEEVSEELCKIKGVGPWTADMFLIFRLGRTNILPLGDIGLVNAINLHYNNKEKLSKEELAKFKKVNVEDLVICILDRERHQEYLEVIRSTGARIKMIGDGDVSAVISSVIQTSNIDMYYGIGGAPEGVLAAAALQCIGGNIEGKLLFNNEDEIQRAKKTGINDLNKIYSIQDLAKGDIMFSATGVTDGTMLKGIKITKDYAETHSIVMRSKTGTIRHINGEHNFNIKQLEY